MLVGFAIAWLLLRREDLSERLNSRRLTEPRSRNPTELQRIGQWEPRRSPPPTRSPTSDARDLPLLHLLSPTPARSFSLSCSRKRKNSRSLAVVTVAGKRDSRWRKKKHGG
ncbi:hypothetical protein TIFTF001_018011 [Ficus carica]|uniref:Uncharacterized protein n=1 Tax=Ficus carica TaxID=3494 RepID=A0AA88ABN6_FICCA|nr:hypothetical protein TIFTF001_018011 [Ficus carica]